ncbi:exonuclease SbcCD subunit D [Streptococcus sp. NLN76]|uniref:exonuclease SbcCD subunit D n=1 Tax=Streptococcus sp. NLN76 TaxID=2822800 RepID=UPI0018AAACE0|nr:exonuclease SbcCD subunit D [Streptococcus sp. NLN76]MBF8969443.1 exonuclease SbcCD subunit D [Streptococcus sp. NLN76]
MKFLHTADWHIGRKLHGYSLLEEQWSVFHKLKNMALSEKVDAIFLAGDLFDVSTPPVSATKALDQMLYELNVELGLPLFIVSGNHDGANRLQFGTRWMKQGQLYLATQIEQALEPIDFGDLQIFLLPFFHPSDARRFYGISEENKSQMETISQAMERLVKDMEALIKPDKNPILISHFYVAGKGNEDYQLISEGKSEIGGLNHLPASLFSNFSYVALGHLHSHLSSPSEKIRYSGSLLKFAVDEHWQEKGVLILDWQPEELEVTFKALPSSKDIRLIRGTYEDITAKNFVAKIQAEGPAYYSIRLTEKPQGIRNLRDSLAIFYPDILDIRIQEEAKEVRNKVWIQERLESPMEIIHQFFQEQTGHELSQQQVDWVEASLLERKEEV